MISVRDVRPPHPGREDPGQRLDVLLELADTLAAAEEVHAARDCYRQAAAVYPDAPQPHVGLGVIALQLGRADEAEAAFRDAVRRDASSAEAYGGLAMARQQAGDDAGAFDMHLRCLQLDGDNLVALLGLFQTSCRMGTFAKVTHYLELFLERHPGDTSVLFCLATLYARDGRLDRARDALRNVLALEPDKAEARELLEQVEAERTGLAADTVTAR